MSETGSLSANHSYEGSFVTAESPSHSDVNCSVITISDSEISDSEQPAMPEGSGERRPVITILSSSSGDGS